MTTQLLLHAHFIVFLRSPLQLACHPLILQVLLLPREL